MRITLVSMIIAAAAATAPRAEPYPTAGTMPDRRPPGAPSITDNRRGPDWSRNYHHGIEQPLPGHLGAADQGAWYTPFNRAGMTAPYDLRGWHQPQSETR